MMYLGETGKPLDTQALFSLKHCSCLRNTGTFQNRDDVVQINYLKMYDKCILSCKSEVNHIFKCNRHIDSI